MVPVSVSCTTIIPQESARPGMSSRVACITKSARGRTTPQGGLYIEMAHLGPQNVARQFPGMVKRCEDCGFDLAGGRCRSRADCPLHDGRHRVRNRRLNDSPGLYAAGEDCGGVHGANRLGGNGVANSTVYGGIAGEAMAGYVARNAQWRDPEPSIIDAGIARAEYPFNRSFGDLAGLREALWNDMWDLVGIVRNQDGLAAAQRKLAEHGSILAQMGVADTDREFNPTWHDWLNIDSLLTVSEVVTAAALARENSRGAHFREDYPESGDFDSSVYTQARLRGNKLAIESMPVIFDIVRPGGIASRRRARDPAAGRGNGVNMIRNSAIEEASYESR